MNADKMVVIYESGVPTAILTRAFNIVVISEVNAEWSYVKKKYKLNITNFPFYVIVNLLSLLQSFPDSLDIVSHTHLEINIHNDYEFGLYCRTSQYIQKSVYMHECN